MSGPPVASSEPAPNGYLSGAGSRDGVTPTTISEIVRIRATIVCRKIDYDAGKTRDGKISGNRPLGIGPLCPIILENSVLADPYPADSRLCIGEEARAHYVEHRILASSGGRDCQIGLRLARPLGRRRRRWGAVVVEGEQMARGGSKPTTCRPPLLPNDQDFSTEDANEPLPWDS